MNKGKTSAKLTAKTSAGETRKCGTFMGIEGVQLEGVTFEFTQDTDTDQPSGDICQSLTVRTPNGGGGAYLVIETTRWAVDMDDIDKFCDVMKRITNMPEEGGI